MDEAQTSLSGTQPAPVDPSEPTRNNDGQRDPSRGVIYAIIPSSGAPGTLLTDVDFGFIPTLRVGDLVFADSNSNGEKKKE